MESSNRRREFLWELLRASSYCWIGLACHRDQAKEQEGQMVVGAGAPKNQNNRSLFPKANSDTVRRQSSIALNDALPDGLELKHFHLYTRIPLTLESKRDELGLASITPISRLFVRNNLPLPDPSIVKRADDWELQIAAGNRSRSLSLRELKQIGLDTVAAVLQCSGNGRRYFPHGPSGSPWGVGAAGCGLWTGVALRKVIEVLGVRTADAHYLTATGGEELPSLPLTVRPDDLRVERSIPIKKALDDALLVWDLNGLPLPLSHGGPLRLIVPGYYGINWVKYVRQIRLSSEESSVKIMRTGYRFRPVGEKGKPKHPTMRRMAVKSWIQGPGAEGQPILAGTVQFHGVAFSGERGVSQVEVSVDGGRHFQLAKLIGPDLGCHAWRVFVFSVDLKPGKVRLVSRARDRVGDVQPRERVENERGYGNNSWWDLGLEVEVVESLGELESRTSIVAPRHRIDEALPKKETRLSRTAQRGRAIFQQADPPCAACHTLADAKSNMRIGPNLDEIVPIRQRIETAIRHGSGPMPAYINQLDAEEIEALVRYLEEAARR